MNILLDLLGIIGRMAISSEEVYACYLGVPEAISGFTSDARTAILARYRYMGLDMEMDKMYAQFWEHTKRMGYPGNVTLWVTGAGEPTL